MTRADTGSTDRTAHGGADQAARGDADRAARGSTDRAARGGADQAARGDADRAARGSTDRTAHGDAGRVAAGGRQAGPTAGRVSPAVGPPPLRTAVASLAGTAVAGVAGVAVTWLGARGLGTAAAGAFFTALAGFGLATTVAKLGTPTGLVYWPARLRAGGQAHLIRACLRAGTAPVAVVSAGLGVGLFVAAPTLAGLTGFPDQASAVLRAIALLLPAAALGDALLAGIRGLGRMRETILLDRIARPLLQVVLLAAAVLLALPPAGYALAWALPYLPLVLLAGNVLRRATVDCDAPPEAGFVRRFWLFTGPRAAASVAQSALQRLDVLLVAALAGLTAAAVYAVATRFVVLGQAVNQAISLVVQPRLAALLSTGDRAGAGAIYQTATGWVVLATWPLHLLVLGFAPVYLRFFGPSYLDGALAVAVLATAMLVATGCGMVDMVLAMGGRTSWNLGNVVLALAVNVGLNLLLVPEHGATGAAVALAASILVNNLVPLAQVACALRMHPMGPGTLIAATLSVTCFGLLGPATVMLTGGSAGGMVASVLLATGCYLAGVIRLRGPLQIDTLLTLRRDRGKET